MVESGCDVIEVGLPYSDPVMDGPTIQAAAQQALEAGTRTADVIRTVEAVAATGAPTVVMTYWNPVERYGVERVRPRPRQRRRRRADHPGPGPRRGRRRGWPPPTSTASTRSSWSRRPRPTRGSRMTVESCRGFVYATAVMGVTGARESSSDLAGPLVARVRAVGDTTRRGGARRLQRRPGRRGRRLRRRCDRRLGLRAPAARRGPRPRGRAGLAGRAHPRPRRRGTPWVGPASPSACRTALPRAVRAAAAARGHRPRGGPGRLSGSGARRPRRRRLPGVRAAGARSGRPQRRRPAAPRTARADVTAARHLGRVVRPGQRPGRSP